MKPLYWIVVVALAAAAADGDRVAQQKRASDYLKRSPFRAPKGYRWDYIYDWDKTVLSKCLRKNGGQDLPIDDAVYAKAKKSKVPEGFVWSEGQEPRAGGNVVAQLCLSNPFACPYGSEPGTHRCIEPR